MPIRQGPYLIRLKLMDGGEVEYLYPETPTDRRQRMSLSHRHQKVL